MLQVAGISRKLKDTNFLLDHISFDLTTGMHLLVGPNGAGKSTLLRLIAGITKPDAGSLMWRGQEVYFNLRHYKMHLGYLPQSFACYEHMTGIEFLRYMAGLKGLFYRAGKEQALYVADLLGIGSQCSTKVSTWSNGLRQRLGIAQALLNNPDILVLDEPFGGLDATEMEKIGGILADLSQDRVILLSSHVWADLPISKLLLVVAGKLQFAGLPTVFVDEAQGQVWAGETSRENWLTFQAQYPGTDVIFHGESCQYRIFGRSRPCLPGVKSITPSLADAYLFWMQRLREATEEVSQ